MSFSEPITEPPPVVISPPTGMRASNNEVRISSANVGTVISSPEAVMMPDGDILFVATGGRVTTAQGTTTGVTIHRTDPAGGEPVEVFSLAASDLGFTNENVRINSADIAVRPDGSFAVAMFASGAVSFYQQELSLFIQHFSADGIPVGTPIQVVDFARSGSWYDRTPTGFSHLQLESLGAGYLVSGEVQHPGGALVSGTDIYPYEGSSITYLRMIGPNGGTEFIMPSFDLGGALNSVRLSTGQVWLAGPSGVALVNVDGTLAWQRPSFADAAGLDPEIKLHQVSDGRIFALYKGREQSDGPAGLYVQQFASDGQQIGTRKLVVPDSFEGGSRVGRGGIDIADFPDGQLVVAFTFDSTGTDSVFDPTRGGSRDVGLVVLAPNGAARGTTPTVLTQNTNNEQSNPAFLTKPDGTLVLTFLDDRRALAEGRIEMRAAELIGPPPVQPGEGDDVLFGTALDDTLYGFGGDDSIWGGIAGNDLLNGGLGDDTLEGGVGADTLQGEDGEDHIFGNDGDDLIFGGAGNDFIGGGAGDDVIEGGLGNDTIYGWLGNDTIYGGDGDDRIYGGEGSNTLFGEAGNDLIFASDNGDFISGGAGNDTVRGSMSALGNDTIHGGQGDDDLAGGQGDDLIYGSEGANVIDGGDGNDTVHGGTDNDTIYGGRTGDDQLFGATGNDLIYGGIGADLIGGGEGDDTLRGGEGNDTIYGWLGDDNIGGGEGNDLIYGSAGSNIIWGASGSDTIQGGTGSDTIYGGGGGYGDSNQLFGNDGDDLIHGGSWDDLIGGGLGNDTLRGELGNDTIYGWFGDDNIGGGGGNDVIFGSAGANAIWGGVGDDTIVAGTGRDVMSGGPGADTFVFVSAAHIGIGPTRDVVTDFQTGVDRIDLSALNTQFNGTAGVLGGGQASFFYFAAGGLLISDQNGDGAADWVLELAGAPSVSVGDFLL